MEKQPFRPGTRVKLSARGLRNQATTGKRLQIDWSHRYGIFQRANKEYAFVLWDGRMSTEDVPLPYIEAVTEDAPYLEFVAHKKTGVR